MAAVHAWYLSCCMSHSADAHPRSRNVAGERTVIHESLPASVMERLRQDTECVQVRFFRTLVEPVSALQKRTHCPLKQEQYVTCAYVDAACDL